ncbi:fibronectin type III domain-containing protein [Pelagicoccus sp. NFK12]|uniref:Fibronectin type III domain-containing protein n=1 Tax=Pelagicoccus enzymogenes TaxID=2773457 RepID=A0A927FEI7_9BACT|nr:fibronectin type III domain-containing protein [Pelagicoccus enzymogenes]MBD5782225.1 fibronectin type III domain-containing protein [Pelagicoccus enzymogenes]
MKLLPDALTRHVQILAALTLAHSAQASVSLNWKDNSSNEDGFAIERSIDGIHFQEIGRVPADVDKFTDPNATEGKTFHYRVRAFNAFGFSGYTDTISATVAALVESASETIDRTLQTVSEESEKLLFNGQLLSASSLPTTTVGSSTIQDAYQYYDSLGLHALISLGSGLGPRSDSFKFTYLPIEQDCQIVVRVPFHSGGSPESACGIMVRSSLAPDSAYGAALLTANGAAQARWRPKNNDISQTRELLSSHPNTRYLKIRRRGSYCWLSASRDGYDWSPSSKVPVALGSTPLVGIFLASSGNTNSIAVLEILESTEPLLAPSLSYYRASGSQAAIGVESSQVSSTLDQATGLYKLTAQGRGFEQYHDQLNFYQWTGVGSCRIVAKIHAFVGDGTSARTGLSLRASLEPDSPIAAVTLNGYGKIETLTRSGDGAKITTLSGPELPAGCYLALERQGNTVSYQWSPNGVDWNEFGTAILDLPSIHHVGLTLGSHDGESASLIELTGLY